MTSLRRTSLDARHRALGGRMVPFVGWELPVQYQGVVAEHHAVRRRAGLFDVSHMGELRVLGDGALARVDALVTNDLSRAADGQAVYTCCCNERGTILDDLIVYRVSEREVLVVCNAANREKIASHLSERLRGGPAVEDESDRTALLALQGPLALSILDRAGCTLAPVASSLRPFRFAAAVVAGLPVVVARTGYTGEDGVELFVAWERAPELWDRLLEAGSEAGLSPAGLAARDTLRLEARLSLYGNEIDETTHPFEAGLAWTVKLEKGDFVGREALLRLRAEGLQRTLVGFEVTGRGIARSGYPLLDAEQRPIGHCTSGAPSPTLGKNIGLGYVPVALSAPGTELWVDCRGKPTAARVVTTPFYRRPR